MTFEELIPRMKTSVDWWEERANETAGAILAALHDQAERVCESEIEKVLLCSYALRHKWYGHLGSDRGGDAEIELHESLHPDIKLAFPPRPEVFQFDLISCQVPIDKYRADFVVQRGIRHRFGGRVDFSPPIVVECDGHNFHEKTKEQAARDKERDRVFQIAGYLVLRFTGSEIWRDAAACVDQIEACLEEHICRRYHESRKEEQRQQKLLAESVV